MLNANFARFRIEVSNFPENQLTTVYAIFNFCFCSFHVYESWQGVNVKILVKLLVRQPPGLPDLFLRARDVIS